MDLRAGELAGGNSFTRYLPKSAIRPNASVCWTLKMIPNS